jgi:chromosome segregation ATPase
MATQTESTAAAIDELTHNVEVLTDDMTEVKHKLNELTGEMTEVKRRLNELTDKVNELTDDVIGVKQNLNDLMLTVKVIESNYVTKEELAILSAKVDALSAQILLAVKLDVEQAFRVHTEMMFRTFATKEELANAVYQLTWRMAAFGSVLLSAGFAFARYL